MFWKGLAWIIATIMRKESKKDTLNLFFYDRHFVLKVTRLSLTDPWIGAVKGILHFTFTVIVCPATDPGDLKFITDSLPLFGLNQIFLMAKSDVPLMWGDAMPHEMYSMLWNKIYHFCPWCLFQCLFLTIVKGNSCLFETCV